MLRISSLTQLSAHHFTFDFCKWLSITCLDFEHKIIYKPLSVIKAQDCGGNRLNWCMFSVLYSSNMVLDSFEYSLIYKFEFRYLIEILPTHFTVKS